MNLEEWRGLIEHWRRQDKNIRHLGIPPYIAEQLGIEMPYTTEGTPYSKDGTSEEAAHQANADKTRQTVHEEIMKVGEKGYTREQLEEATGLEGNTVRPRVCELLERGAIGYANFFRLTKANRRAEVLIDHRIPGVLKEPPPKEKAMTEGTEATESETTTTEQPPLDGKWKKKKYFDGTKCGLKDCNHKPDGYIADAKPTKGNKNGQLWYGPACVKCIRKTHDSLNPLSLAELAFQRDGASDLAMVLDIEVGEAKKRLEAAGIDEQGNKLEAIVTPPPPAEHPIGNGVDTPTQPELPHTEPTDIVVTKLLTQAITIPADMLADSLVETNGVLTFLGTFHIVDQPTMDMAAKWLKEVKAKWKDWEELRKVLGKPLREGTQSIQDHFKPALTALVQAEGILKQKITEGNRRAGEAQREAMVAAQTAHQAGDLQGVAAASQQVAATTVSLPQSVGQRPQIRFEVVDPSLLPGQFWSPDAQKVQAAINEGHREIPGVRIWEEQVVSSRAS